MEHSLSPCVGDTTEVGHCRDLRVVLEREEGGIGVLNAMQEPTKPMRTEAVGTGFYHSPCSNMNHPRLQILTVADLLAGKSIDMHTIRQVNLTFKPAEPTRTPPQSTLTMPLSD